ncbi:lipocalin family protein [soil metagenome]
MRHHSNSPGNLLFLVAALVAGASFTAFAQSTPLRVVPEVDLNRYAGTWYEIARLPNRFEEQCAGDITANYAPRPDGRITVTNRCRESNGNTNTAEGVARRVDGRPPSVLKVRFAPAFLSWLPQVWGDYQIIELGPDYDYAVVGSPDRKYLWVLGRRPQMDESLYAQLLARAAAQGFDTTTMIRVSHRAAERPPR